MKKCRVKSAKKSKCGGVDNAAKHLNLLRAVPVAVVNGVQIYRF